MFSFLFVEHRAQNLIQGKRLINLLLSERHNDAIKLITKNHD